MIEKNKLAELIDGYAIAKSSGNASLLELSLNSLKNAIDSLYAVPEFQEEEVPSEQEVAELAPEETQYE